jgi:ATP-dependent exoDNAse (exonuclease V) beta subunit
MMPVQRTPAGDQAARDRIRHSLHESLLVEASAGTGKTSELVRRIVAVLAEGLTRVGSIAAVTFTNKAAGELKLRLRLALERERALADGDRLDNLDHALAHLEEASIGTIHAFCAQILRERPVEAKVDPAFQELTEREADSLFDRAFQGWFQERLDQPSPGLRRALTRLAWPEGGDTSPIEDLKWAGRCLLEWRDHRAPWARPNLDRIAIIDRLVDDLRQRAVRLARRHSEVRDLVEWIERAEALAPRDYDTLEARFIKLLRDVRKNHRSLGDLVPLLEEFAKVLDMDLAAELQQEMFGLIDRYERLKYQTGHLDFLDLLLLSRDLVRTNREVREYLQTRFTHLFIDEFQDTDPVQAELLLLLSANTPDESDWRRVTPAPGKLFAVGDPKQSIYKFRRADMGLYLRIRDHLTAEGAGLVRLTTSFRSARPIQECVNAAFALHMRESAGDGQIGYSPLEEHAPALDGQPSVVVLPVPEPYGAKGQVTKTAINACLPTAVAKFVEWLLHQSGWRVREGGALTQIAPRHICILFRRRVNYGEDLSRAYTEQLEALGIPHLLAGSKSYREREEVEILRTALTAIEWPLDELSVFATLRGPLFAIDDSMLLRYRHAYNGFQPFAAEKADVEESFAPVKEALGVIADLHRRRNTRPIADTIHLLMETTRAQAAFGLRRDGHHALANLYRLADLARAFELEGGISFRGFVESLHEKSGRGDAAEAPVMEEGSEGVRLLTVHAAKGLEFPVVILADLTAKLHNTEPDRYLDAERSLCAMKLLRCMPFELMENRETELRREESEGVRLAYVAATRARDLLVVPAVGDGPQEGWVSPLNPAIYPARGTWRRARSAGGCPKFGPVSAFRQQYYPDDQDPSVQPGLHRPEAGTHEVVWWDPALLRGAEDPGYAFDAEIIAEGSGEGMEAYQQWQDARKTAIEKASVPGLHVFTAWNAPAPPPGPALPVEIVTAAIPGEENRGRRFGILVHAILRDADPDAARVPEFARLHGRLLAATEEEMESASAAVRNAMRHPLLQEAFRAKACYRELPVTWREGTEVFEGVIDCAYEGAGGWTVIDFKTDSVPSLPPEYRVQIQWYAYALGRLTGRPVRAVLVRL